MIYITKQLKSISNIIPFVFKLSSLAKLLENLSKMYSYIYNYRVRLNVWLALHSTLATIILYVILFLVTRAIFFIDYCECQPVPMRPLKEPINWEEEVYKVPRQSPRFLDSEARRADIEETKAFYRKHFYSNAEWDALDPAVRDHLMKNAPLTKAKPSAAEIMLRGFSGRIKRIFIDYTDYRPKWSSPAWNDLKEPLLHPHIRYQPEPRPLNYLKSLYLPYLDPKIHGTIYRAPSPANIEDFLEAKQMDGTMSYLFVNKIVTTTSHQLNEFHKLEGRYLYPKEIDQLLRYNLWKKAHAIEWLPKTRVEFMDCNHRFNKYLDALDFTINATGPLNPQAEIVMKSLKTQMLKLARLNMRYNHMFLNPYLRRP